jgi:hypothetical protein
MQGKLPLAQEMIRALVRPLGGVMGSFFSFVGVEGGKVRPRAAVVAGLVAALALLAVLRGGPSASGAAPTTTAILAQSPSGGTAVDPGPGPSNSNLITYTLTFTLTSAFGTGTTKLTAEMTVDSNFIVTSLLCSGPAGTSASAPLPAPVVGAEVRCQWSDSGGAPGLDAGGYIFWVTGYALPGGDNDVDPPTDVEVCNDATDPTTPNCDDESSEDLVPVTTAGSVGVLTINPNLVAPATITVAVGSERTIVWTLQDGYTCESDDETDTNVNCTLDDVVLAPEGAAFVTAGPTVNDADIVDETTVAVTISSVVPGTVTVTLKTRFVGQTGISTDNRNPNQAGVDDVAATVTFAAAPGRLMGDVDCDNNVTAADALKILRYLAGLSVVQNEPCPDIGTPQ